MLKLHWVHSTEIHQKKYNHAVLQGEYPQALAGYEALNALTNGQWYCLVNEDYSQVFPVPYQYKWKYFKVGYQPFFIQQLGIFGRDLEQVSIEEWLVNLPSFWLRIHLQLHGKCGIPKGAKVRSNLVLPLDKEYETLRNNYKKDARKNLENSQLQGNILEWTPTVEELIQVYQAMWGEVQPHIQQHHYERLKMAIGTLNKEEWFIKGYQNSEGERLGGGLFIRSGNRWQYILGAPTQAGRKVGITHLLIDEVIRMFAGTDVVLDFEGSELPTVRQFYEKWNPIEEKYYSIHLRL